MKKFLYKITSVFLVSFTTFSCSDYLDVQPKDKVLEDQVYTTEAGVQNAHNGLYLTLASDNLYGRELTMDAVDILGQQYNMPGSHYKKSLASYAYAEAKPKETIALIWEKSFAAILASNKFLESIEEHSGVVSVKRANMLKGEAIGIRAMLHFDMLRLFGPIYKVAPSNPSIPYYDVATTVGRPLLPANEVINKVLADIDVALGLLTNDPILTTGKYAATTDFDANPYYSQNRGQRINYLALKCLKARVLLYSGDKPGAFAVANEVINFTKSNSFFPWTTEAVAKDATNPDRTFSSENFFSISDYTLYTTHNKLFSSSLPDDQIYAPLLTRINAVFENNDNDYRSLPTWKVPVSGGKTQKTFYKYEDVIDKTKAYRLQIPMFKLSEMYLIAAETATVKSEQLAFLNTLRNNRGLANLAATVTVTTELTKEYKKEFIGEGQLFYYYKRNNTTSVPNGSATTNISMSATQYVLPLPDSEMNFQ